MEWAGRYRLIRQIARGGMGEVWEATASGEGGFVRRVAIKRLLAEHDQDPAQARMFLDEARIASQLHHANILSILDYGVVEGLPYQVLEYVDGVDAERLRERGADAGEPFPVALALHLCTEVAHALQYAHEARDPAGKPLGIVHRDVSPSNILVSWRGDVKLADFGIALARDRQERTRAGLTKGKPAYMSPEQVTRGELDGRSDLFALGCVLHALLTGHSPLAGEDRMADLLAGKELELSETLPADVRDIIARAVRRARHQRFQSAAEFAAASGKALAARIDRDARSLLSEWMAQVRSRAESTPRTVPGRAAHPFLEVEQLLGGVVPRPLRDVTSVSASQPVAEPREVPQGTLEVLREPPQGTLEVPPVAPWNSRRWQWAGLVLILLGGVGALRPWRLAQRDEPSVSPPSSATAPPAEPLAGGKTEAIVAKSPPPLQAEAPITPAARPEQGNLSKRLPRSLPSPESGDSTPSRPLAADLGTLAVGGAGALRAEILIDGKSRGHAPKLLELQLGEHVLELVTPEGRRVGPERIRITRLHTPASPLRWIMPEEVTSRQESPAE
ncbi:serine/threonine-protein kinase [Hyalangium sp.]|uniref:serine/threonine-protein kinase n=1 Tax=Hyalangium sp. TaxID=2028555 RepID=UPI002D583B02|nr:protein kinase [Hyalangium sp.]HYI02668.1 protein kinase [Hyalangium sp.]